MEPSRTAITRQDVSPEQQFLRLMSHEMRTPLNGVIGMLGLLSETSLDGAQKTYSDAARASAEHLLGLVNDLLDYARLEAGALEFDPGPVDVVALTQGVAELLSPRAHDKGLEIAWTVAPDVGTVVGDEGRLRQVLFNLAGNAVKFTDRGGVLIAVRREGDSLALVIDDTGPGVPPEARERIFEEFGHADVTDATRHDGAGLGLAVVRRLALAMGGEVMVTDRPGGGARFRFCAALEPVVSPAGTAEVDAGARSLKGVAVRVLADGFLRTAAEAQITAAGGRVADDAAVVLVDHGGGPQICPPPGRGQALLMLRPSERGLIDSCRAAGYAGYLIKPLRPASVIARVRAAAGAASRTPAGAAPRDDDRVTPAAFSGVRVLLAEDNPVGALLAGTLLRREGCVVETVATGGEAVEALRRARYDLVLMDMRMPGADGPTAARAIRATGDRTPVLALTANAFAEDRKACLEAGMNDHLVKPLTPETLRAALARWTNATERAKVSLD